MEHKIEVVEIRDYLTCFYWGRHPEDPMLDMRLGGGTYALHKNGRAIVIDSMTRPGQGTWVREYLERTHQITHFTLVSSHWHVDHIIDNHAYADSVIIGHKHTRDMMLKKKAVFEAGEYSDYDAFKVEPPNLVFEGRLDLWLGDLKVELHEYKVHEAGHLGVLLPDEKIFIANDILEDPLWFFDFGFASAETQLNELERLKNQEIDFIFPCHCSIDKIKKGGFSKKLIEANINYLKKMMAHAADPDFDTMTGKTILQDELDSGVIEWWEPYTEVHEFNKKELLRHV